MKIEVQIKEEFSDEETEYVSDISNNSNSNSFILGSSQTNSIVENSGCGPVSILWITIPTRVFISFIFLFYAYSGVMANEKCAVTWLNLFVRLNMTLTDWLLLLFNFMSTLSLKIIDLSIRICKFFRNLFTASLKTLNKDF